MANGRGTILRLAWSSYDGSFVKLRQRKTGKPVEIPVTEELKISLDQTPCNSPNIVVNEVTGRPYKEDHFRHEFARIRKKAGLEGLWFMDLRRTAVVRLAEAECSIPEMASITGHELDRTTKILETYLPRTSVMASNAITKLEKYKKRPKLEG